MQYSLADLDAVYREPHDILLNLHNLEDIELPEEQLNADDTLLQPDTARTTTEEMKENVAETREVLVDDTIESEVVLGQDDLNTQDTETDQKISKLQDPNNDNGN